MARSSDLEKMSFAELTKMQADIERMKIEKQNSERAAVKQKLLAIAEEAGFDLRELFGKGGKKGSGPIRRRVVEGATTASPECTALMAKSSSSGGTSLRNTNATKPARIRNGGAPRIRMPAFNTCARASC